MGRRNFHFRISKQECEKNNETSMLLLTITVLFGVTSQIIENIKVSDHPIIWFSFEVATVMLLSSTIYSMASWRTKEIRRKIYQQISLSQMIVTMGLLVSILLFYIGDRLAESQSTTTFFKNIDQGYPVVTLLGFVLLPLGVYTGNVSRTIELLLTLFGGYVDPKDEEAGAIAGFLSIVVMFAIIFSIGASGVSKTISIVALVILVIILPYISVLTREKLLRESGKIDRIILYILNSYVIYFTALLVSSILDISEVWDRGITNLVEILTSITGICTLANIVLLVLSFISIHKWKNHKNIGYGVAFFIMLYGIVSALPFFIKNATPSLTEFMMFFYLSAILIGVVLPVVSTSMFSWIKRKIRGS